MESATFAPWLVMAGYAVLIWLMMPTRVSAVQFFNGEGKGGSEPGLLLLVASAAITWIFAKSISNAANLSAAYGWIGGLGYAAYYLCFVVVGVEQKIEPTLTE